MTLPCVHTTVFGGVSSGQAEYSMSDIYTTRIQACIIRAEFNCLVFCLMWFVTFDWGLDQGGSLFSMTLMSLGNYLSDKLDMSAQSVLCHQWYTRVQRSQLQREYSPRTVACEYTVVLIRFPIIRDHLWNSFPSFGNVIL